MNVTDRPVARYAFELNHHGFTAPTDPTIPIWRYMDFTKFISLLETKSLYFCRTDLLGDPWEGSLTRVEAEKRKALEAKIRKRVLHATAREKILSEVTNSIANCWHMNKYESMAMWRLYLTGVEGVAIRSTYQRLTDSFPKFDGVHKGFNEDGTLKELLIHVGVVHYVDYDSSNPPSGNRMLFKRMSFEHEREIRAVIKDTTWGNSPTFDSQGRPLTRFEKGGDYVPSNLRILIERVYVSPEAPIWFDALVRSAVKRYNLPCPVHQSDLGRDPVF